MENDGTPLDGPDSHEPSLSVRSRPGHDVHRRQALNLLQHAHVLLGIDEDSYVLTAVVSGFTTERRNGRVYERGGDDYVAVEFPDHPRIH